MQQRQRSPDAFYRRTMEWHAETSAKKEEIRKMFEERKIRDPNLTFKPVIKPAIAER